MAFPIVVTTQLNAYHGIGGPYVNSAGTAVYLFGRYNGDPTQVQAFKATDPATSWAGVGTNPTVASGNTIRQMAAYQYGDSIHVVTRDAAAANSNQLRYHLFNMATDSWELTNELIKTTYTCAGGVDDSVVTIVARSAGAKFVSYEGPQVLADIQRSRAYYAQNLGAAWSADIALDGGGNAHWFPQETILGAGNRVHFFIVNNTAEDLYQRTLNSANALEALPAAFDVTTTNQSDEMVQRGVAYSASAGGTVVIVPYLDSFTPTINDVRFTSVDVPSPLTIRTDITTPIVPTGGLFRRNISFAADGNTIYSVFTNNSYNIYVASSQDAGSWAAPALLVPAASATEVYTNIYTRLGSRKLGVCYTRENTDTKYTEYTLNVAPSAMTERPDHFDFYAPPSTIQFNNAAWTSSTVNVNSIGLLLTATANSVLLVWTTVAGGTQTMSSVLVGSTPATFLGAVNWTINDIRTELWGMTAPPAGTLTISATIVGSAVTFAAIAGATYTGHRTTGNPFGGVVTSTGSSTLATSLTISATTGSVTVFGFTTQTGPLSLGTVLTSRANTYPVGFPYIQVADAPGQTLVTGTAALGASGDFATIGINLIQSGGSTIKVLVSGRMSATDAVGTLTATGYVITVVKQGRLSATGASDLFSASSQVIIQGRMSATDAVGTFSSSGTVYPLAGVLGRLSATGASDTFSASGYLVVRGRLSAAEAFTDAFVISGTTITPAHGSVAWTMRQDIAVINPRQPVGLTPMGPSNAGGGAGVGNKENVPWPTDLWDAREAYLLSLYPEGTHPAPELEDNAKAWQEYEDRKQQLVNLTAERAHAIVELRESPDLATMKSHGAHIKELTAKIATLTGKQDFARFMRH